MEKEEEKRTNKNHGKCPPSDFLVPRLRFDCPFPSSLFQHVSVERCKIHRLRLKVLRLERHDLRPAPQTSRLQSMVSQRQAGAQGTSAAPRAGGARRARLPAVRAGLQSQDPAAAAAAAKSRQSCPTLCDPKDMILSSGPITSWQIDGETMETMTDFIFLGSKITADSDCMTP